MSYCCDGQGCDVCGEWVLTMPTADDINAALEEAGSPPHPAAVLVLAVGGYPPAAVVVGEEAGVGALGGRLYEWCRLVPVEEGGDA